MRYPLARTAPIAPPGVMVDVMNTKAGVRGIAPSRKHLQKQAIDGCALGRLLRRSGSEEIPDSTDPATKEEVFND